MIPSTEPPPILGWLLWSLPPPGARWSQAQRKLWLDAAAACIRFLYYDPTEEVTDGTSAPDLSDPDLSE